MRDEKASVPIVERANPQRMKICVEVLGMLMLVVVVGDAWCICCLGLLQW